MDRPISYSQIMSNNYLPTLTKNITIFVDLESFIQFLIPWYGMEKHHLSILTCLQSIFFSSINAKLFKLK